MMKLLPPPEEGDKSSGLFRRQSCRRERTEHQKGSWFSSGSGPVEPARLQRSCASLVFSAALWSSQTTDASLPPSLRLPVLLLLCRPLLRPSPSIRGTEPT